MEYADLNVREDVRAELAPGEHLLWHGQPGQGLLLRPSDLYQIPFSLMWCGFAIFWESGVIKAQNAPGFFMLWGIPFVAVGLYLVAGRFFVDAWQRSRTRYALTDQRVLIVSGLLSRNAKSLSLRLLPEITLSERGNGGTITFGATTVPAYRWPMALNGWPGYPSMPCFEGIPDARAVYQRIRQAQAEASAAPAR